MRARNPDERAASALIQDLKARGKWPSKPDLEAWYGASGSRWQDKFGTFQRAVTLPDDPELFTRHEVVVAPPDLLVTNYSMLEYTLMRPLERPIFDQTRLWLETHTDERLLLVIDEAHLYRGASGTEVGLLIRRFRDRLGIEPQRLQVICTSASFDKLEMAGAFAASLTGKSPEDFTIITGDFDHRTGARVGTNEEATHLASVDLDRFYESESEVDQAGVVVLNSSRT